MQDAAVGTETNEPARGIARQVRVRANGAESYARELRMAEIEAQILAEQRQPTPRTLRGSVDEGQSVPEASYRRRLELDLELCEIRGELERWDSDPSSSAFPDPRMSEDFNDVVPIQGVLRLLTSSGVFLDVEGRRIFVPRTCIEIPDPLPQLDEFVTLEIEKWATSPTRGMAKP
jgi:hypothetical protein